MRAENYRNRVIAGLPCSGRVAASWRAVSCAAVAGLGLLIASQASFASTISQSLLLDVGNKQAAYNGTNDPAHADQPALAGYTTFQGVNVANPTVANPTYADGTTATGITITVSRSTTAGGSVFAATNQTTLANGGGAGAGIFSTTLTSDDLEVNNAAGDMGVKITGLAAGQYYVYAVMPAGGQLTESNKFSVGPNIDTLTAAGAQQFTTGTITNTTTWVGYTGGSWNNGTGGDNYVRATVTLNPGDSLNAISENLSANYSKFDVLEVVPVPEPAALGLVVVGGMGMLARRRRT